MSKSTTTTPPAQGGGPAAPSDAAPIRVCIVGHVDHGKSTLIGRLLMDSGAIHESRLAQLETIAKRRGGRIEYANLLDAFQAERDQNITIDTGQIWFRATRTGGAPRDFRIVDAPGHREFLKNMVTGAAQADVAVLVVDAKEGVQQQTRSHAWLLAMVDVKRVLVVVNKMDLVDWSEVRFDQLRTDAMEVLRPLGITPLRFIPISAYNGDNVVERSDHLGWSTSPTLLGALAELQPPPVEADRALRFVLQDVYRFDERRILAGRVESGTIRVGDQLIFSPGRKPGVVKSIETWSAPARTEAHAGDSIGITLTEQIFVERGHIGAHVDEAPGVGSKLRATVFWMGDQPFESGKPYTLKLGAQETEVRLEEVERLIDAATLQPLSPSATAVGRYEVGEVVLNCKRPVAYDDASEIAETGRFVIVDDYRIAGGGRLTSEVDARHSSVKSRNITWTAGQVTEHERAVRGGHPGSVVWLTGLSASGKSTLARTLERRLFDDGRRAFVLDGDNLRFGLNSDLGFAPEDRSENIRRVSEVARLLAMSGEVAIVALISPYQRDRSMARAINLDHPFVEVFVDCALEVCEQRDPKGLYKRARAGEITGFTGISAPYEAPRNPDVHAHTDTHTTEDNVDAILSALIDRWDVLARAQAQAEGPEGSSQ